MSIKVGTKWISIVIIALFLAGCKANKFTVNQSTANWHYLSTKSKLKYEGAGNKISAQTSFRMKRDSVLWISVSPIFGIEALRAMVTRDSVKVLNRISKEYTVYDYQQISNMLNFQLDFTAVQSLFLAKMPIELSKKDDVKKEKDHYYVRQESGPFVIENYFGKEDKHLTKLILAISGTENQLDLTYGAYEKLAGDLTIPKNGEATIQYFKDDALQQTKIAFEHAKIQLPDELSFPFKVPNNYKVN